jgi:hypothetical protein
MMFSFIKKRFIYFLIYSQYFLMETNQKFQFASKARLEEQSGRCDSSHNDVGAKNGQARYVS